LHNDEFIPEPYKEVTAAEVHILQKQEAEKRKKKEKSRSRLLRAYGFEVEHGADAIL
jgi:hypothetical protein